MLDGGHVFRTAYQSIASTITRSDLLKIWTVGMISRDSGLRSEAWSRVREILEWNHTEGTDMADPFWFGDEEVDEMEREGGWSGADIVKDQDFEEMVKLVKIDIVNQEGWENQLEWAVKGLRKAFRGNAVCVSHKRLSLTFSAHQDKSYIEQAIEASTHAKILTILLADFEHRQLPARLVSMLLVVLRQMAEFDTGTCADLDVGDEFVEIISYANSEDPTTRYNLARLLFAVYFRPEAYLSPLLREMGGEGSADMVLELRSGGGMKVPKFVTDRYLVYSGGVGQVVGLVGRWVGVEVGEEGSLVGALRDYRHFMNVPQHPTGDKSWFFIEMMADVKNLKASGSHDVFAEALRRVEEITISQADVKVYMECGGMLAIQRVLSIQPANDRDIKLFTNVVKFFLNITHFDLNFDILKPTLLTSIPAVALPMIQQESAAHAARAFDPIVESHPPTPLGPILMQFLLRSLHLLTDSELFFLLSTTETLQTLTSFIRQILRKGYNSASLELRRDTLHCLTRIGDCQSLNVAVDQSNLTDLIKVLAEYLANRATDVVLGVVRDDYGVFVSAVGAVKIFAEVLVGAGAGQEGWGWGDWWLYSGSVEWFRALIDHDDEVVSAKGWSILGCLFLLKGSGENLKTVLRRGLEGCLEEVGKGGVERRIAVLRCFGWVVEEWWRGRWDLIWVIRDGNFENAMGEMGFWERVKEFLGGEKKFEVFEGVAGLFLGWVAVDAKIVTETLMKWDIWAVLFHVAMDLESVQYMIVDRLEETEHEAEGDDMIWESRIDESSVFQWKQNHAIRTTTMIRAVRNVLHLARAACWQNESMRTHLLERTDFVALISRLFGLIHNHLSSEAYLPWLQDDDRSALTSIAVLFFAEILEEFARKRAGELQSFWDAENQNRIIMKILHECLAQTEDTYLRKAAASLFANLCVVHFSGIVDLGLEELLASGVTENGGKETIGVAIFELLVSDLMSGEFEDAAGVEASRIGVQFLMGRIAEVKRKVAEDGMVGQLIETAGKAVRSVTKMDEEEQMKVLVSVSLIRHMLAGSTELKISAKMHNIHTLILDVLSKAGSVNERLLLETLYCLRNFMVGWDGGKRVVLGESNPGTEKREKGGGKSVAAAIVDVVKAKNVSEDVFFTAMEILKMICGVEAGKIWVIKSNVLIELDGHLDRLHKAKEIVRLNAVLQVMMRATSWTDVQAHYMRVQGVLDRLVDVLSDKAIQTRQSALLVLRNMALLKENRPHFLTHDEFLDQVTRLLQSKHIKIVAPAVAVVAALLWDFEKAKVVLKNKGLKKILLDVEERIDTDYAWFFDQQKDADSNWEHEQEEAAEGMSEEDEEMLLFLKQRVGFVNSLL
ncbi:hypothetical protein HK097_003436 [Rhizophlyctis rosea]|uniref:Uncharacterized protein n=1 Tax=Rhizophlyctis rosea TaxID=64517 RepID=A0AAD5S3P4_9FUNG|nr:hypothetical protein HK097_003436 [Rhizophlyctis rosea]